MLYTKEFYELMDFFEKISKKTVRTGSQGLKRSEKEMWPKQQYYDDGMANEAFKLFMQGYSYGKSKHQ